MDRALARLLPAARHHSALKSALWALAGGVAVLPVLILIAVCAKWILLGRVRPGRHPLWGAYYLRWWFVQTLVQSVPLTRLGGTPLLPFVYRLFGVGIGKDVHIATELLAAFDVISIGEGASIDEGASLLGYTVEDGDLVIAPITVGAGCLVGTRSVLCPGAVMEDGARLEDLSLLPGGARIPAGETWSGSPAQKRFSSELVQRRPTSNRPPLAAGSTKLPSPFCTPRSFSAFPLIELSAFVPGVGILTRFHPGQALFYLAAPLAGACFIVCVIAEVVAVQMAADRPRPRRQVPGARLVLYQELGGGTIARVQLDVAGPLHSTIFLKPWYRALGARLGRFVEISTASTTTPDLLDIEEDCTIADEVSLGAARVERGWLTLAPTRLGRRAFVGNGAVIPAGTTLGAGSLVGVLTVAPPDREQAARNGACWLGSPAIFLKRRQPAAGFPEETTFRPSRKLQWARGCWEILRVTLPGAGFVIATVVVLETALKLWMRGAEREQGLGVPLVVEQDVQMVEGVLMKEVCLVDEKDGADVFLDGVLDVRADGEEEVTGGVGLGHSQRETKMAIEVASAKGEVLAVDKSEVGGGQGVSQGAQQAGLADAGLSGEQGAGARVHGVGGILDQGELGGREPSSRRRCPWRTARRSVRNARGNRGSWQVVLVSAAQGLVEQGLGRVERGARLVERRGTRGVVDGGVFAGVDGMQRVAHSLVLNPRGLGGIDHAARDGDEAASEKAQGGLPILTVHGDGGSPRTRRRTCTVSASRSMASSKLSVRGGAAPKTASGVFPIRPPCGARW